MFHLAPLGRTQTPVLIVGDSGDIPAILRVLEQLPDQAYGQVYIELASGIQRRAIPAPAGITVTWLLRDRHAGYRRPVAPRGSLAARALSAWFSEWLPDEHELDDNLLIWVGCATSPTVSEVYHQIDARLSARKLHEN